MRSAASDITVIGGGWSVRNIAIDRLCGFVIGVNDAGIWTPRGVDLIVSMDRVWTEYRWPWLLERKGTTWLRRSAVQNCPDRWEGLTIFECDHESSRFTDEPGRLNGTNSGACALNLAYQMRPRRVFLLGFDMNRDSQGRAYWYAPYPWAHANGATTNGKYAKWALQFNLAALAFAGAGIEVYNVSPRSAIRSFPKMTPSEYARECM